MYTGLKSGKKRRADLLAGANADGLSEDVRRRLEEDSSSSEEEYTAAEVAELGTIEN